MSIPKKKPFQDLWIAGLDPSRSQSIDAETARIYFQLSAPPPLGWSYIFTQVWQATEYSMKCQAGMDSGAVWIDCRPEDLKQFHMEKLETAVAQTNAKFRDRLQEQAVNAIHQRELRLQLQSKLEEMGQVIFPAQPLTESSQEPSRSRFRTFLARWMRILFLGRKQ